MNQIYRITIHGRTLESKDLRQLLARAVSEKRSMDRAFRAYTPVVPGGVRIAPGVSAYADAGLAARF